MHDRSRPSDGTRGVSRTAAGLALGVFFILTLALAGSAGALTFSLIQNGSGAHLTGFWEQTVDSPSGPVSSNCADYNCCLDLYSTDGRIIGNGCGASAGMGGSLDWYTSPEPPNLTYASRVSAVSVYCIYGNAWAELASMTASPVFRIDAENPDELSSTFDLRITPTFCLDAIVEHGTGTAHGSVVARYRVQVNDATVTEDSLVVELDASSGLGFPGGTGNTVVLSHRQPGDTIRIATYLRFAATSTGDGTAQLSNCNAFSAARILLDATLLNVTSSVEESAFLTEPRIRQVLPNPTALEAEILYFVPAATPVRLSIHDLSGRLVADLVDRFPNPGEGAAFWDGRDNSGVPAPAGVYVVRLAAGSETQSRKLVLLH